MKRTIRTAGLFGLIISLLTGCTYNPFIGDNHLTGSATATAIGAGAGVGTVALFRGSAPALVAGGITGGAIGYYLSTLRFDSGGVIQGAGQVYQVGDLIGIYIPSDMLFEPNTARFTHQAPPILDSAATILQRYPNNNILISGNTSGFGRARWELKLSLLRARKVSAYLWSSGVNQFRDDGMTMRKLNYVGYGDYFPISNKITNDGIRENSRIQITSYPSDCDLQIDKRHVAMYNVGGIDDTYVDAAPDLRCHGDTNCYDMDGSPRKAGEG